MREGSAGNLEIEWEKLVKQNVGPAGLYDLYLVKYRDFKYPQRVFRLNQRGIEFLNRLRKKARRSNG